MRLGKSNLSAVEKITIVLMNLLHLPISALFHQDIILHIQAVYQWQVLIVSVFPLKYTVLVKDNQHLYAYLRGGFLHV